jgi:hypothetical protein
VSIHQFEQLSAARDVLIFEAERPPRSRRHQALQQLFVERRELAAPFGEKTRDGGEAVLEMVGARRTERERLRLLRQAGTYSPQSTPLRRTSAARVAPDAGGS